MHRKQVPPREVAGEYEYLWFRYAEGCWWELIARNSAVQLCASMAQAACSCWVGGWFCLLTARGSLSDFPGVGHKGRQAFPNAFSVFCGKCDKAPFKFSILFRYTVFYAVKKIYWVVFVFMFEGNIHQLQYRYIHTSYVIRFSSLRYYTYSLFMFFHIDDCNAVDAFSWYVLGKNNCQIHVVPVVKSASHHYSSVSVWEGISKKSFHVGIYGPRYSYERNSFCVSVSSSGFNPPFLKIQPDKSM